MTQPKFDVTLTTYQQVSSIAGGWNAELFRKLLQSLDCDSDDATTETELHELVVMCLQDLEIADAAKLVLNVQLGGALSVGQIQNLSEEFADEKHWEHYADQSLHERLFHVGSLMYEAFEREIDKPDAVRLEVEMSALNQEAKDILKQPLHESFIVRLLADGMPESSVLHRLFDEQLAGKPFAEAEYIIWIINPLASAASVAKVEIFSSCHWLDPLKRVEQYQSTAAPDLS